MLKIKAILYYRKAADRMANGFSLNNRPKRAEITPGKCFPQYAFQLPEVGGVII